MAKRRGRKFTCISGPLLSGWAKYTRKRFFEDEWNTRTPAKSGGEREAPGGRLQVNTAKPRGTLGAEEE